MADVVINDAQLLKQLRNDMKDDWFPDPLVFKDMLESGIVAGGMLKNFADNHGQYVPVKREVFNIPKSDFTLRCALETGLADRVLYHSLISDLVPFYDQLMPWNVFSHRFDQQGRHPGLFKPHVPAWRDFVGAVRSAITPNDYFVSTDISNYYENIDLEILQTFLIELIPNLKATATQQSTIRSHIALLFRCLESWSYKSRRGLPQNRDASSFLANIYMLKVDRSMRENGYADTYFRYMDDIKIVCTDEYHARRALKDVSLMLRNVSLALNSRKTQLCSGADAEMVKSALDEGSPEVQHIHAMWNTRSRDVIKRSIPLLKRTILKLLADDAVHKREFRFCLRRMEFLASCIDLAVPDEFFDDVTPKVVQSVFRHPASTDQFVQYLRAARKVDVPHLSSIADYLADRRKAIYTWQNYLLWSLLAQKRHFDEALLSHAGHIVDSGRDDADRAGATLYIGALGGEELKIKVAERFNSLTSFIGQRSALIAIHELHFRPVVESNVPLTLRDDLVGVYRKLRENPGVYFAASEPMSITNFVDLDRAYE